MNPTSLRRALSVLCLISAPATSQAAEHWRLSAEQPAANFISQVAENFAHDVHRDSDGDLQIEVVAGSTLYPRPQVEAAVASGEIQMGDVLLSALEPGDPLFQVDSVPFLVSDYDHARKLWEASRPLLEKRLQAKGIRLLYAVAWPPQSLFTRKPINTLADFQGMKWRTYNAELSRMAQLLGATPTLLSTDQVTAAYQSGGVDSMISSSATGVDLQAWKFSQYFYDIRAFIPKNVMLVNEAAFQRLSDTRKAQLLELAKTAETRGWELSWALAGYQVRILQRHGINVSDQPSTDVTAGLQAVGQTLLDEWLKTAGPQGAALIAQYRKQ